MLHGVNASNSAKHSPDRLPWHGPEHFTELAEHGFNVVRWVMAWGSIMPEEGVVDGAFLDALETHVGWAHEAGLLVILDMHQDVFGYGFGGNGAPRWACDEALYAAHEPRSPWWLNYLSPQVMACFDRLYTDDALFARFEAAWVAVAERFADHPGVVGFDLLNEPHWGTSPPANFVEERWQPRMEALSRTLHALAPEKFVFFQGITLSVAGFVDRFRPAGDPRTAFSPHYYHPVLHEGGEYEPAHDADIARAFEANATMAADLGEVPVWLGEFGGPTQNDTYGAYIERLLFELAARRWSWAYWSDDLGNTGFSLRDVDGALKPQAMEPLGHPYARRTPGPLHAQAIDFEARCYTARFTWTRAAPLELWSGRAQWWPHEPVVRAMTGDGVAQCDPVEAGPAGLWRCSIDEAGLGAQYTIVMGPPEP